jgi:hypothetical protein
MIGLYQQQRRVNKMGDRANFGFRQSDGNIIYLYGHWAGEGMMNTLAEAIAKARPRWNDESYATRICISQIIGNEWQEETGWGISTSIGDNEHSIPIVDWESQAVCLYQADWNTSSREFTEITLNRTPKFAMGLEAFINKFAKYLTTV